MSKKKSPKAPTPPDPNQIIGTEAQYNRYNVNTPFGSSNWSGTPGSSDYGVSTTLSPQLQGVISDVFNRAGNVPDFNSGTSTSLPGNVANIPTYNGSVPDFSQGASTALPSNVSNIPSYSANDPQYKALESALYNDQASQFEPAFAQQSRNFESGMANRGQPSGGEAYDTGFANMSDAQNRARIMAANQATIAGRNAFEQDRGFANQLNQQNIGNLQNQQAADRGFDLSKYGAQLAGNNAGFGQFAQSRDFANQLNQQNVQNLQNQQGADRGFDLSKYGAMLGGNNAAFGQLSQLLGLTPNNSGTPLDITNPYSMNQAGQLAKYQGQLGANQGMFGDLSSLLGTGLMAYGMKP